MDQNCKIKQGTSTAIAFSSLFKFYHAEQKEQAKALNQSYALYSTNQWTRFIAPSKQRESFEHLRKTTRFQKIDNHLVEMINEQQSMLYLFFELNSEQSLFEQGVQILVRVFDVRPIARFACLLMVNDAEFALFIDKLDKKPLICTADEWKRLDELDIWQNKQVDLVKVSLKSNDFVYCQLLEMLNLEIEQEPNDKLPFLAFVSLGRKAMLTPYYNYTTSLLRDFSCHLDPEEPRPIWFEDLEQLFKYKTQLKTFKRIMASDQMMHPAVLNMLLATRIDEPHVVEAFLHAAATNQAKALHSFYVHRFKRISPVLGHAFQIAAKREHEGAVKTLLSILVEQEMLHVLPKSTLFDMENATMANFTLACMLSDPTAKNVVREFAEYVHPTSGMTVFHKYVMLGVDKVTMEYLMRTEAPHDAYMTSAYAISKSQGDTCLWRAKDEAYCQGRVDLYSILTKNNACSALNVSSIHSPVTKVLFVAFPGCDIASLISTLLGAPFLWDSFDTNVKHVDIPSMNIHAMILNAYNFDPCSQAHRSMMDTILAHSKDQLLVLCYGTHQEQSTKMFHLVEQLKPLRNRIVLLGLVQGKRKVLASFATQYAQKYQVYFAELIPTEQQVQKLFAQWISNIYQYEQLQVELGVQIVTNKGDLKQLSDMVNQPIQLVIALQRYLDSCLANVKSYSDLVALDQQVASLISYLQSLCTKTQSQYLVQQLAFSQLASKLFVLQWLDEQKTFLDVLPLLIKTYKYDMFAAYLSLKLKRAFQFVPDWENVWLQTLKPLFLPSYFDAFTNSMLGSTEFSAQYKKLHQLENHTTDVILYQHAVPYLQPASMVLPQELNIDDKKVLLLPQYGDATMVMHTANKSYWLKVSTLQMHILLLCNEHATISLSMLQVKHVSWPSIKHALERLCHAKILQCSTAQVVESSTFSINTQFASSQTKLNIE